MNLFAFVRDNAGFLGAGAVLMFTSSYGQTFFISIFAAQIMADFALSDGGWGLIYTLATSASALAMFWAGALTDRFRVTTLAKFVIPGLAVSCLWMAVNETVTGLVFAIFVLRLLGQGMTFQLAATAMARWFVRRRGLALSLSSMGFAVAQASLPPIFAALLLMSTDWRWLWFVAAAMAALAFPVLSKLLAAERTPQSATEASDAAGMEGRHWTRSDVLRSSLFWCLLPMLLGPPSWGTALFFQQVHIAEVKGWPLTQYLALIPILTAIGLVVTLVSGQLIDRFGTGRLMQFFGTPWIIGFLLLAWSDTLSGALISFAVFGVATGLQATLITAFWAEFYGTRHIGAIKATSTSIMVLGSAVGPGVTGVLIDLGFSFPDQMIAIAAYFALSAVLVWIAVERTRARLPASA
ncbi:MAG: MFS transporter [Pseudomonadota bacterium]